MPMNWLVARGSWSLGLEGWDFSATPNFPKERGWELNWWLMLNDSVKHSCIRKPPWNPKRTGLWRVLPAAAGVKDPGARELKRAWKLCTHFLTPLPMFLFHLAPHCLLCNVLYSKWANESISLSSGGHCTCHGGGVVVALIHSLSVRGISDNCSCTWMAPERGVVLGHSCQPVDLMLAPGGGWQNQIKLEDAQPVSAGESWQN